MESLDEPAPDELSDDVVTVRAAMSWAELEAYVDDAGHRGRVTFLDGEMAVVSPGRHHEHVKYVLCALIDRYLVAAEVPAMGGGSWAQTIREARVGVEPDAGYVFGPPPRHRERCNLAIEVISTSGSTRKLEAYRRLGVEEVWFWVRGRIEIYSLREASHVRVMRSGFLPGLDPDLLVRFVQSTTIDSSIADVLRRFSAAL